MPKLKCLCCVFAGNRSWGRARNVRTERQVEQQQQRGADDERARSPHNRVRVPNHRVDSFSASPPNPRHLEIFVLLVHLCEMSKSSLQNGTVQAQGTGLWNSFRWERRQEESRVEKQGPKSTQSEFSSSFRMT